MMSQLWLDMGFIRYPLGFSVVVVGVLSVVSAVKLFANDARADGATRAWVDAILFWGGFAMVTGVLGTLVGVVVAAQSIEHAGEVSSALVWGGIKVALLSAVFGTLVLGASGLVWFGLQLRWRLLRAWSEGATAS